MHKLQNNYCANLSVFIKLDLSNLEIWRKCEKNSGEAIDFSGAICYTLTTVCACAKSALLREEKAGASTASWGSLRGNPPVKFARKAGGCFCSARFLGGMVS